MVIASITDIPIASESAGNAAAGSAAVGSATAGGSEELGIMRVGGRVQVGSVSGAELQHRNIKSATPAKGSWAGTDQLFHASHRNADSLLRGFYRFTEPEGKDSGCSNQTTT